MPQEHTKSAGLHPVELVKLTPATAHSLWSFAHEDMDWPIAFRSKVNWSHHNSALEAAMLLGSALILGVQVNREIAGFVTCSKVEANFLPDMARAIECGTYLLPNFRGTGLNQVLKRQWMNHAFLLLDQDNEMELQQPLVMEECPRRNVAPQREDYCVFVVKKENTRALCALVKLGFRIQVWPDPTDLPSFVETVADRAKSVVTIAPTFSKLVQRKAWETGESVFVLSISRSDFTANVSHLPSY